MFFVSLWVIIRQIQTKTTLAMHKNSNNNFLKEELHGYFSFPGFEPSGHTSRRNALDLDFRSLRDHVICPLCGGACRCRHSAYTRHLSDRPLFGKSTVLHFHLHKYYCRNPSCPRKIVAEPVPGEPARSRRTSRLTGDIRRMLLPVSFREASRQLRDGNIHCSPGTCRRILYESVPSLSQPPNPPVAVGIDDFAYRKGSVYGSVVVDQYTRIPLDLIPSRSAEDVRVWLDRHPGIQYVTRDGGLNFRNGIASAQGCITQIRDRFHLVHDLVRCLERTVLRLVREYRWEEADVRLDTGVLHRELWRHMFSTARETVRRKYERYVTYNEMKSKGYGIREIALRLGTSVQNAHRHRHMQLRQNLPALQLPLFRHLEEVAAAIAEKRAWGEKDIPPLFPDIPPETLAGLDDRLGRLRRDALEELGRHKKKGLKRPSGKDIFNTFFTRGYRTEHRILQRLMTREECRRLAVIACEFREMINGKADACPLEIWMKKAKALGFPEVDMFVKMVDADREAVSNAIHIPFNNGLLEGTVCKIKAIKRHMYGKASSRLLKMKLLKGAST